MGRMAVTMGQTQNDDDDKNDYQFAPDKLFASMSPEIGHHSLVNTVMLFMWGEGN